MQKSKLGVSIGLLGAAVCFLGLFGSYVPVVIATGYILLFEENEWLKKNSVKVLAVMITLSVMVTVVELIPDAISVVSSLLNILNINFSIPLISSIVGFITSALLFFRTLILLGMGLKALNQGTISVPIVDNIIDKHM